MRLDRLPVVSVAALLAASAPLFGQDAVRLAAGARVRIVTRWTQTPERSALGAFVREERWQPVAVPTPPR
jgi:hypothetical protein